MDKAQFKKVVLKRLLDTWSGCKIYIVPQKFAFRCFCECVVIEGSLLYTKTRHFILKLNGIYAATNQGSNISLIDTWISQLQEILTKVTTKSAKLFWGLKKLKLYMHAAPEKHTIKFCGGIVYETPVNAILSLVLEIDDIIYNLDKRVLYEWGIDKIRAFDIAKENMAKSTNTNVLLTKKHYSVFGSEDPFESSRLYLFPEKYYSLGCSECIIGVFLTPSCSLVCRKKNAEGMLKMVELVFHCLAKAPDIISIMPCTYTKGIWKFFELSDVNKLCTRNPNGQIHFGRTKLNRFI
jgi:hypothetical protein